MTKGAKVLYRSLLFRLIKSRQIVLIWNEDHTKCYNRYCNGHDDQKTRDHIIQFFPSWFLLLLHSLKTCVVMFDADDIHVCNFLVWLKKCICKAGGIEPPKNHCLIYKFYYRSYHRLIARAKKTVMAKNKKFVFFHITDSIKLTVANMWMSYHFSYKKWLRRERQFWECLRHG